MGRKRTSSLISKVENPAEDIDFDVLNELHEEGLNEEEIASELNLSKSFVKKLNEESEEDY